MEASVSFVSPSVEASLQCVLKYLSNGENRRSFQLTLSVEEKQECVVLADLLKNGSLKCIKSVGTVLDSVQDTCNRCSHPAMGRRGEIHLSFSLEDIACDTCDHRDKESDGAVLSDSIDSGTHNTRRRQFAGIRYCCNVCKELFITPAYLRKHVLEGTCCSTKEEVRISDTNKSIVSTNPLSSATADIKMEDNEFTDTMKPSNKQGTEDRKNADKTYECDVCAKTFSGPSRLKDHKLTHLPRSQFSHKCNLCGKSFKRKGHLHEHKRYYCNGNKIPTRKDTSMTNPKDDHVLEQDSDVFLHEASLASHDQAVTQKIEKCKVCSQIFKTASHLKEHMLIHLKDSVGRDQKSENDCNPFAHGKDISVTNPKDDHVLEQDSDVVLQAMTQKTDLEYRCALCDKMFNRSASLRRHQKTHKPGVTYDCNVCRKTFVSLSKLRQHVSLSANANGTANCMVSKDVALKERISSFDEADEMKSESGPRIQEVGGHTCLPYQSAPIGTPKSNGTSAKSKHSFTFKMHKRRHIKGVGYKCDVCEKPFELHSSLRDHKKTHLLPEVCPHKCKICGRLFKKSSNLNEHMLVHLKDSVRPDKKRSKDMTKSVDSKTEQCIMDTRKFQTFSCSVCNMGFRTKLKLKFHVMTHLSQHMYSCDECVNSFLSLKRLEEHCLSHISSRGLACSLCSEEASFSSSWDLYKHMKTHWGENGLLCRSCNTEFENPELLAEHHCEVEFVCDICGEDFPNQTVGVEHTGYHDEVECKVCMKVLPSVWKLNRHMATHAGGKITHVYQHVDWSTGDDCGKTLETRPIQQPVLTHTETKAFECGICNSSFRSLNSLKYHRKLIHTITGSPNPWQCHLCGKKMSTQQFFDRHLKSKCVFSEDEKQKCKICGLVAFNSVRLEQHMRIHSGGEQPFICELCGKGFYSRSSLGSHFFTHKNYRPYSCDICGRKFRNRPHMQNHRKMHTGEGLLQCKECKDWFIDANYLKNQHFKYCKGGKVYQCQDCPRVFNDKKLFENHLGFHTGTRPFECTECGRAFPKEAICNDHYKRHFQEFKFRCPLCDKSFQRMTELRKHKKLHDKNHNYMRRYTLSDVLKPKSVVMDKIITEEEFDQATLLLTDEMTTSQTVVKEEFQTQFDHQQIAVDKVCQVHVGDLTSGVPSTTIENDNAEQVVTITTLPSGELTFSHGGLSNESVIVVTIEPNVNLEEES